MKELRQLEMYMQRTGQQLTLIVGIGVAFIIGLISGVLLRAELLTIADCIQAYSAIALTYFAFIQVSARRPVVFSWAEDWRDLYIENASDYPIFDIFFEYTDINEKYGVRSDKIKIIHSKKNRKIQLNEDFQGEPSMIVVTIEFRTEGMQGPIHKRRGEVLLREPGSLY